MGIEFLFAQFVEMYGKPNAKLVPDAHLEDLFAEGAGFAGFAAGEIGQGPHDPDLAAMPDPASFTPRALAADLARFACDVFVEGEPWPYCPRTILTQPDGQGARSRATCSRSAWRLEFFLLRKGTTADRGGGPLDDLDRPCYDMKALTRQFEFISTLSKYQNAARLGQLRERPRGRERPVRVELRVRRRADDGRPGRSSSATWSTRWRSEHGLLATFMPKPFAQPDRQRLPLHMTCGTRRRTRTCSRTTNDPRGLGLSQLGLPLPRRAC